LVQPFCAAHPFTQPPKSYALQWAVHSLKLKVPLPVGASALQSNTWFLGPRDSAAQTAWSLQPFLHSSRRKVPILYNGPPLSSLQLPIPIWESGPPS